MAGIVITKVVRQIENVIISHLTDRGLTLGQIVDEHLEGALSKGDEVQSVSIEMEQSEWDVMRAKFLSKLVTSHSAVTTQSFPQPKNEPKVKAKPTV